MVTEKTFEGKWYAHPPLRNALIAGFITGVAFLLSHIDRLIPQYVEIAFYIIAILLGGYHWAREGIEELIEEEFVILSFQVSNEKLYLDIENKKSKSRFIKVYNLNNGIQIGEILLKESENYD